MTEFENIRVDYLFDIETPKRKFNANTVEFGGEHPYVARSSTNNGIRGYISEDEKYLNDGGTISYGQDTATVFFQPDAYFTGDKIKVMRFKHGELKEAVAIYLVTCIRTAFSSYSWGQQSFNVKSLGDTMLCLPVKASGEPDFDYMAERVEELEAERVEELEAERVEELEAYLRAARIDNYELTVEERKAVLCDADVLPFRIGDLFDKLDTPYYGEGKRNSDVVNERTSEYCVPVVTAKRGNNGICRWTRKGNFKTYENVISVVTNGAVATGLVYYQPSEVSSLIDSYLLGLKTDDMNEQVGLYIACAMQKVIYPKYSRDNKAYWSCVQNDKIWLPVTQDGNPDYEYMVTFIKAQEKLAIRDAIGLKDDLVKEAKRIIERL